MRQRNPAAHRRGSGTCLILLCLSAGPMLAAPARAEPPGQLVDIGTHRLHIHCMGEGMPTVVIDSGLGGFSLEWRHVQELLARHTKVCAYDRAGYGWSDPGPGPRTSARIAHELRQLLDRAKVPAPYLLVGHSFGGYNVRYFASEYPSITAGLVLVDASHPDQFGRFPGPNTAAEVAARSRRPGAGFMVAQPVLPANYPEHLRREAFMLMGMPKARETQIDEFLNFQRSAAEVRTAQPLPHTPLLILSRGQRVWPQTPHGDEMERIWQELQQDLASLSPHSLHLVATSSGHSIHLDQPEAVVTAVTLTAAAARSSAHQWPQLTAFEFTRDPASARDEVLYLAKH